jgi:hypothetical protein
MAWLISIPVAYIILGIFQVFVDLNKDLFEQPMWVGKASFKMGLLMVATWFTRPITLMLLTRRGIGGCLYAFTLSLMRLLILSSVVRFFILAAQKMTDNIWIQITYAGGMLIGLNLILRLLPFIIAIADLLTGILFVIFRITGLWKGIHDPSKRP